MANPEHLALQTRASAVDPDASSAANILVSFSQQKKPPFEATNLGHLAAEALRHGMTWTIFRPEDGTFLAEGNGHILRLKLPPTYTFEYIPQPVPAEVSNSLYVASPLVDKLFFGILPGDPQLNLPDYHIGTNAEVYRTMYALDPTGTATKKIRDNRHPTLAPKSLFGFSDIIPLAGAMLRGYDPSCTIARLPIPAEYTTGLLTHQESFVVFRHRLDAFLASSPHHLTQNTTTTNPNSDSDTDSETPSPPPSVLQKIRTMYHDTMTHFPEWEDAVLANSQINNRSPHFLARVLQTHRECTAYFQRLHSQLADDTFYPDLLATHLSHAVNWWHESFARIRSGTTRPHYGAVRTHIAEGMHLYWDYLDSVVEDMQAKGWIESVVPREMLKEAWV
ncbi:MAG: hypothetical protein Q9182_005922, partial [Xanthomendoza sp. 2 TL-2023]